MRRCPNRKRAGSARDVVLHIANALADGLGRAAAGRELSRCRQARTERDATATRAFAWFAVDTAGVPPGGPATIEITGYRGKAVPCVLHSAGGERGVGVVFPGAARERNRLGGTPARPDLHYTRAVLRAEGLAVFEVWWDAGSIPDDALDEWLDANVRAAQAAAAREHPLALLAGRALGTMALARVVSNAEWEQNAVPTVWLAPLLRQPLVVDALARLHEPAFIVGGDADPAFDVEAA
jgi:hypothetical protein